MTVTPPENKTPGILTLDRLATPIGEVLLVTDEAGRLRALDFSDYAPRMRRLLRLHYGALEPVEGAAPETLRRALSAYFGGDLSALASLAWATGGTDFQRQVWMALTTIPAGETVSYRGLAQRIGRPTAMRAVGLANGSNPVAVVVPCHRVIGADGSLTGYAGGLERKRWLLAHEQAGRAAA